MMAAVQREADFKVQLERRRLIEAKLAQLAETERWQHELLQQAQLRSRAFANANGGNRQTTLQSAETSTLPTTTKISTNIVSKTTQIPEASNDENQIVSTTESIPLPPGMPKHCAPVQRFITVFKVKDPTQWLQENCTFVKRYFPNASCSQIETLLASCFKKYNENAEIPVAIS